MEHDPYFPKIPTSRTGRVPQWVLDEAAGRPVQVVPFRGATHSVPEGHPAPGARRKGRLVTGITFAAACAGVALYLDPPRLGGSRTELPAVAWSPCRPLHFVTRPDNAPAWGPAVLAESVARVSQAAGPEVMFPRGQAGVVEFSAGDQAGLAALGRGACQPDV